jgi:hypothetical protein
MGVAADMGTKNELLKKKILKKKKEKKKERKSSHVLGQKRERKFK